MQLLHFIETPVFEKRIKELFTDDEYLLIQQELLNNPVKGDLIQGTGGLRKIRFGRNSGKSGGVRILYYYTDDYGRIYMIAVYTKSSKDNITSSEKAVFKAFIQQIKWELENGSTII